MNRFMTSVRSFLASYYLVCSVVLFTVLAAFFLPSAAGDTILMRVRLIEWFAAVLFSAAVLYIICHNRQDNKEHAGLLFSCFVFSITLFWSRYGIDFGDDGFNSTVSWFFVKNGLTGNSNRFYIGSTIFNGLLMNLHTPPLLFWNRMCAVWMITVEFLLVFKMFRKYAGAAVYLGLISAWFLFLGLRGTAEIALNYSSFPTFLSTIFLYFLYRSEQSHGLRSSMFLFGAGALEVLIAFSRLPLITLAFFIVVYFGCIALSRKDFHYFINKILWFILGIVGMIAILAVMTLFIDGLAEIGSTILRGTHDMIFKAQKVTAGPGANFAGAGKVTYLQFLLLLYIKGAVIIIVSSLLWLGVWIVCGKIFRQFVGDKISSLEMKWNSFLRIPALFLLVLIPAVMAVIFGAFFSTTWYYFFYGFVLSVYLLLIIRRFPGNGLFFFFFWGFVWAVCSILGSNTGVKQMIMGSFLFCPVIAAAIQQEKERCGTLCQKQEHRMILAIMAGFLVLSVYAKIFDVNLRDVDKLHCRASISDPFFAGIKTGSRRAEEISKVLQLLRKEMKESDTFLCFNSIPMLYYALDKQFPLSDPWLMQMGTSGIQNDLNTLREENRSPNYILFSIFSGREPEWSTASSKVSAGEEEKYQIVLDFLSHPEYQIIFQDEYFVIYKKI